MNFHVRARGEFTGEKITRAVAKQRVATYRKMDFHVRAREGKDGHS
ncbi:unnamed protein product [Ectocarpus sp. CCAP 1310/34]|nr:unnamed protein product [Ectocarpus sp. CCAP 1310/34]